MLMLYNFDKRLRLLIFNEIEKIEIALRCKIVNVGCEMTGDSFWMTNVENFIDPVRFSKTLTLIESELHRSREDFILHFFDTYSNPYPPAWILSEVLPFGIVTGIFRNIRSKKMKKMISQAFDLQIAPFESWLTVITLARNSCCHHARVWNKQNSIKPMTPNRMNRRWILLPTDKQRIYYDLCIIKYFVDIIDPDNDMSIRLRLLLSEFPEVDVAAMGFPDGWQQEPLWQANSRVG